MQRMVVVELILADVGTTAVGLHSNPGISVFETIYCTQIPEFDVTDVL